MDRTLAGDARALLRGARAWVEELVEEGVDAFERPAADREIVAAPPEPRAAAPPEPASGRAFRPPPPEPGPEIPRPPSGPGAEFRLLPPEPEPGPAADAAGGLLWQGRDERPSLERVSEELGECTRCRLSEGRNRIVFGDGNPDADLLFVGEGPGADEDRRGLPFVGRAGELLTQMIEKGLGIARADVYICNIVKCRPPGNRTPLADEVAACRPFLDGQIAAVRPRVIVALGKPAASLLLGRDVAITRVRGTWHEYRGIPLMPTYHPAFVLRQYTQENRRLVWEDLKAAHNRAREP